MTRVGLIGGKDIGPSTGITVGTSPRLLIVFTLALTEAARSILLRCFLDLYWLSAGPPSMKLMVGRGSGTCSISAMALSAVGATVAPRVGSLRYRVRWPTRINISTINLRLWH